MARLLSLVVWAIAAVLLAWPALRRDRGRPTSLPTGELVKDPVCQTYVVRARAVLRMSRGEPRYYCSVECARRDAPDRS